MFILIDISIKLGFVYDKLEEALARFDDGPFFLGQFSLVRILSILTNYLLVSGLEMIIFK